jgi:hypothetical protein
MQSFEKTNQPAHKTTVGPAILAAIISPFSSAISQTVDTGSFPFKTWENAALLGI